MTVDKRRQHKARRLTPSLEANTVLPGVMTHCSWQAGWRSLLLRGYDEPGTVKEFTTAATSDQLFVLITRGGCPIESRHGRVWQEAQLEVGSLGMIPVGDCETLRWRDGPPVSHLQLQLPDVALRGAAEKLWGRDQAVEIPYVLKGEDRLIARTMLDLRDASSEGFPDLYAETAAAFLSVHLLRRYGGFAPLPPPSRERNRLRRVDDYMRDHLSEPISLEVLAGIADISRFHLLRSYKKAYGDTPFRRLTQLRMERARKLLKDTEAPVIQIALACGYDNPTNFSSAFRRSTGVTPSHYRQ
ncbi:MAG: helix-turn-helix transcriptional regulator [Phycisphaerales bacterium]|nr:helix-turn-helix transcriptional regulator [Hyphomonadaceae bacterium]